MRRSLQLAGRPQGQDAPPAKADRFGDRPSFGDRQSGARPRQRFVQDGDVPVTVVNRHRPQEGGRLGLPGLDGVLAAEQAARAKAERALQEAQTLIHDLQTKLGHADLARRETTDHEARLAAELAVERTARLDAEAALGEVQAALDHAEQALRAAAEQALRASAEQALRVTAQQALRAGAEKPPVAAARKPAAAKAAPVRLGREPKPVKWWLASVKR